MKAPSLWGRRLGGEVTNPRAEPLPSARRRACSKSQYVPKHDPWTEECIRYWRVGGPSALRAPRHVNPLRPSGTSPCNYRGRNGMAHAKTQRREGDGGDARRRCFVWDCGAGCPPEAASILAFPQNHGERNPVPPGGRQLPFPVVTGKGGAKRRDGFTRTLCRPALLLVRGRVSGKPM
jgi:hypothetical protein